MPHTGSTTTVMPDGNPERVQWDDRAALEELERVHVAIDEWRTRRKQAQAAFEEFVQGFRKPPREREIGSARRVLNEVASFRFANRVDQQNEQEPG